MSALRRRLDAEMVRRGLAPTRHRARHDIEAGRVRVGGVPADKPARMVAPDDRLELAGPPARFVGRGGDKLDAALEHFGIAVEGRRALDAGSSTGGFTDCLLQRGAASVVAVDVGYGQLDLRLRQDPRVTVLERTNVRQLTLDRLQSDPFPLIVADLSFISLRTVAPALLGLVATEAGSSTDLVLLVKPQFEAGRAEASKGKGVIRDPEVWARVLKEVCVVYAEAGAGLRGVMASPLVGAEGNVEFLVHLVAGQPPSAAIDIAIDIDIDAAVAAVAPPVGD
ncbi:MAG: rRNA (cytidine1920-2-O)/16S rRNA (cytidine1409-2-O)-methyltransferase [Actinomycetota bacterium]|nr:rRNA (cytidine1920-2-O)/16S rRNA (cytidine1409-2-O)-methyltransferase [Actinomycetota bacterium]